VKASVFDPLKALELIQGIRLVKSHELTTNGTVDLVAEVEVGRTPLVLAIELKETLDPRSVDKVLLDLRTVPSGWLPIVAAPYVAPGIRRRLEAGGVGWMDAFGNAHIDDPGQGVVVHVERPIPRGAVPRPRGHIFGPAAGRVAQALIEEDEPRNLADLAGRARVRSLSTVSRALSRLEEEEFVLREPGGWIVSDKTPLLDAWLDAKLRLPGPSVRSFFTQESRSRIVHRLESLKDDYESVVMFTGSFAAERLVPVRSAETVDVYVFPSVKGSTLGNDQLDWTPTEKHPIVRLLLASNEDPMVGAAERRGLFMVGKAQLVLDLHREGGRAIEVAKELRQQWGV
jgi:hypothetical protein